MTASHPRLLIHNPGNKKCQKCPAGLLNIHTIQNISPPSKNFQLLFTSSRFCLEYVPFIQFLYAFSKKQRNYYSPWNYNLISLLYHGTSTVLFCEGLGRMTKEHNCQLLLFCIQFLQWSLVSQTKAHGDESLHCKLWFAEKKKTLRYKKAKWKILP